MKKLNKYLVYVDNGKQTTSKALVASSKKSVMKSLEGQGDIVAVKNLTEDHTIKAATVREVLQASKRFDGLEVDWIVHALTLTGMIMDGTEQKPAAPDVKAEQKPATPDVKVEQKPAAPDAKVEQKPKTRKPAAPKQEAKPDAKPMEEKKSA